MVAYRRYYIKGGCYFFTVTLLNRRATYLTDHVDALRHAFRKVKQTRPFTVNAIVILPDHLHCVWTLPEGDDNYSLRWREIKSLFSRQLPTTEYRNTSKIRRNERAIWQPRFWEHSIRDEQDYQQHLDYIHYNPVKHGYVNAVHEWEYSSFHQYVKNGVYAKSWASNVVLDIPD